MERKTYIGPDLHAPRHREQIKDFLSHPDKDPTGFFGRLKLQHPQLEKYSNREIAAWITEGNKLIAQEAANSRHGLNLPEGLGAVITGMCKPTEKKASSNVDFHTSRQLGFEVHHRNDHTNDYVAKIYYTNNIPRCKFKKHHLWRFKPCRALSRAVSAIMKSEQSCRKYIHFSKAFQAYSMFCKHKFRKPSWRELKAEREREQLLQGHNEFSFD